LFRRGQISTYTPETREETVFLARESRQAAPGVQTRNGSAIQPTGSSGFEPDTDTLECNLPPLFAARTVKNCWAVASSDYPWKGPNNVEMTTFGVDRIQPSSATAKLVTQGPGRSGDRLISVDGAFIIPKPNAEQMRAARGVKNTAIAFNHSRDWHWTRSNPNYPIIAPNWSCGSGWNAGQEFDFGRDNANCKRLMNRRLRRNSQIGMWPCDPDLWPVFGDNRLRIPDTEYSAPSQGSGGLPAERNYPALKSRHRAKAGGITGWQDEDGTIWILSTESTNWRHISDESRHIAYFVSAKGKTAVDLRTMRGVTRADSLRPRWKTHPNGKIPMGRNPWDFGPYAALNTASRWTGGGQWPGYVVDYRRTALNQCAPRTLLYNEEWCTGNRYIPYADYGGLRRDDCVDLLSHPNVPEFMLRGILGRCGFNNPPQTRSGRAYAWPVVSYGCRVPFQTPAGPLNAMPYDFAAPVFLQTWVNKLFVRRRFKGDV